MVYVKTTHDEKHNSTTNDISSHVRYMCYVIDIIRLNHRLNMMFQNRNAFIQYVHYGKKSNIHSPPEGGEYVIGRVC